MPAGRVDWIDYSKGVCIILLVILQATFEYEQSVNNTGWMHAVSVWASPFVLPALFLIAGLFLKRALFGSKSAFFDRNVLRFVYFYALWLTLQTLILQGHALLNDPLSVLGNFAHAWIEPSEGLWILPMLAIFHIATWLLRFVQIARVLLVASLLQIFHAAGLIHTGLLVVDRFAEFYIFFFAGYVGINLVADYGRALLRGFSGMPMALGVWAVIHTILVYQDTITLPLISLIAGFAGIFAMIGLATQLSRISWFDPIRFAGRHYLVIYLTYFIPLTGLVAWLSAEGHVANIGLASLLVAIPAILLPLAFYQLIHKTPLISLYRRPVSFRLKTARPDYAGSLLTSPSNRTENA